MEFGGVGRTACRRNRETGIDRGSATLVVREHAPCRLDNKTVETSMRALALAFRLSCFGEGSRRGLGCFKSI